VVSRRGTVTDLLLRQAQASRAGAQGDDELRCHGYWWTRRYVVERYTAVGTQQGQFGDLPALTPHGNLDWNQHLSQQVRTNRGGLV
jgi:hypothetical protein